MSSCTSLSYNQLQELKSSSDSLVKDSMDALSELERGLSDANKKLQRMDADQHAKVGRLVEWSVEYLDDVSQCACVHVVLDRVLIL